MVRFDEDQFDHELTGYPLKGSHAIIDCRGCHQPNFIKDSKLRNRSSTFLGLNQECNTCHEDPHRGELGLNCMDCHTERNFAPATLFDHDQSNFPLKGQHKSVDCYDCHKEDPPLIFKNLSFANCIDCHESPHESRLLSNCNACHSENSFNQFAGRAKFDHEETGFTLKGKHRNVSCFDCHASSVSPVAIFRDQSKIDENDCVTCHEDVHNGKFGINCFDCHTEAGFSQLKNPDSFDHEMTDFPLVGQHIEVDCEACHSGSFLDPLEFQNCFNCHDDFHQGQFTSDNVMRDCDECHSPLEKFSVTHYSEEDHAKSGFPLEGSHLATPCFACHLDENEWVFKDLGTDCISCHEDIHEGHLVIEYYPNKECKNCHSPELWSLIEFDHNQTNWPLTGKHKDQDCGSCHFERDHNNDIFKQVFKGLSQECAHCHDNPHGDQFLEDGSIVNCDRCHKTNSWSADNFNHDSTSFPLEGKHIDLECGACHHKSDEGPHKGIIIYKIEKFDCIDCHS